MKLLYGHVAKGLIYYYVWLMSRM